MSWTVLSGWPSAVVAFAAFRAAFPRREAGWHSWALRSPCRFDCPRAVSRSSAGLRVKDVRAAQANCRTSPSLTNFAWAWLLYRERREHAFASLLPFIMIAAVLAVVALRGIVLARR